MLMDVFYFNKNKSIRMFCIRYFSVKCEIYSNKILLLHILHFKGNNIKEKFHKFILIIYGVNMFIKA